VSTTVTRALATIPELLARAADRDAERVWLRTDDGSQTFAGAAGLAGALAHRLRDTGVRHGDLVLVTTRTTPAYLLTWLALAALGAVTVPTDPKGTPGELAGLVGQVRPRLLLTDTGLRAGVDQVVTGDLMPPLGVLDVEELVGDWRSTDLADRVALPSDVEPDDLAVLIPTSVTNGRSKLVMQTQRAYAMAG
jgi:acyl-CoA synthetase (AMP-forming)/AMP-acid ligase II